MTTGGRVVPREGEPNWGTVERRIERVNEAQKAAGSVALVHGCGLYQRFVLAKKKPARR